MSKVSPCLWFNGQAEDAAKFYVSLFPGAGITTVSRYGAGAPFPSGTALMVEFTLAGQRYQALNGGPHFSFSEAISLSIDCADQAEVDHYWNGLSEGGTTSQCGWLKDRYGLSWQVVPSALKTLMSGPDPKAGARVMQALMTMRKIDIAALQKAHAQS